MFSRYWYGFRVYSKGLRFNILIQNRLQLGRFTKMPRVEIVPLSETLNTTKQYQILNCYFVQNFSSRKHSRWPDPKYPHNTSPFLHLTKQHTKTQFSASILTHILTKPKIIKRIINWPIFLCLLLFLVDWQGRLFVEAVRPITQSIRRERSLQL